MDYIKKVKLQTIFKRIKKIDPTSKHVFDIDISYVEWEDFSIKISIHRVL